ncbi:MAG: CCA tRNA nucleotidyltransferase [Firmicutes bacterium]|nr:CCA tRNA nucleotidyltransferase [Bacillota bacterium]
MELDKGAREIIRVLEEAGFSAYAVGGCVRDYLLGLVPKDIDITTSARPETVKELFPKTFDTGIEHGTVTVLWYGTGYEVTTFRTEGKYSDHRRPDHVEYARSLEEDLSRRDFTINAMAYHPSRGLIDLFGGKEDLESGVVRCVGRASERFEEDALRMLRAIRFAARFGFRIEEETIRAAIERASTISYVSKERIWDEIRKTLVSDHPEYLSLIFDWGMGSFISEILQDQDLADHQAPKRCEQDLHLRAAAWLHGYGEEAVYRFLREMKTDLETIRGVSLLVAHISDPLPSGEDQAAQMREMMRRIGRESVRKLLKLKKAVCMITEEEYSREEALLEEQWEKPVALKELALTGRDLIAAGDIPGPQLGAHLEFLLDEVIRDPEKNKPETLIALFRNHWYNKE